jgi:hypothetical protein
MQTEKSDLRAKNIERSNKITEWLKSHELISRNALCTLVGYDVSNLAKVMNGTSSYVAIPPKHLDDIERILSNYGFAPDEKKTPWISAEQLQREIMFERTHLYDKYGTTNINQLMERMSEEDKAKWQELETSLKKVIPIVEALKRYD